MIRKTNRIQLISRQIIYREKDCLRNKKGKKRQEEEETSQKVPKLLSKKTEGKQEVAGIKAKSKEKDVKKFSTGKGSISSFRTKKTEKGMQIYWKGMHHLDLSVHKMFFMNERKGKQKLREKSKESNQRRGRNTHSYTINHRFVRDPLPLFQTLLSMEIKERKTERMSNRLDDYLLRATAGSLYFFFFLWSKNQE